MNSGITVERGRFSTLGLGQLLMLQAAQSHQNLEEYPGASTVKGVREGPTWSQLWRQNLGQCDQIRINSRGGLQTQEAKLGKNPGAESHSEFYNELKYQIKSKDYNTAKC